MNGGVSQYARVLGHVQNPIILPNLTRQDQNGQDGQRVDPEHTQSSFGVPDQRANSLTDIERNLPLHLRPADIHVDDRAAYKITLFRQACTVMALCVASGTIVALLTFFAIT